MRERRVILGLGTNLGDRLGHLRRARSALDVAPLHVEAASHIYETEPVGPPQPWYLNAALRVRTALPLLELLAVIHHIEEEEGRVRRERWGPRTLDIDILWAEGETVDVPGLTVPHPRLLERAFALAPLLDVIAVVPPSYSAQLEALGGAPQVVEASFVLAK